MWFLPHTPLKPPEERRPSLVASPRPTCPPQIEGSAPLSAVVTNNKTFSVVRPLSSSLSPISPASVPPIHYSDPSTILADDGLCFSHLSSRGGFTIVSKSSQYRITHFTIDNSVVDRIAYHPYHPREGTLWGLIEGDLPLGLATQSLYVISDKATYIMLGSFCFDPISSASQTYPVLDAVAVHGQLKFSVFYLGIEKNWGGSHTCLCNIKLHGEG